MKTPVILATYACLLMPIAAQAGDTRDGGITTEIRQELADARREVRTELAQARTALHERKTIDRAKGLLMQRQGLTEQQAYERLRRAAMDRGLRLAEVAQRMLDAADLLG